jgi:glycosyltransferase involved in cell wall biosynthesis
LNQGEAMDIDVILRTHNRAAMLGDAVASFFAADHGGVAARLLVVDNASSDGTAQLLAQLTSEHGARLVALHEPRPGGQHALNCGLARADAPLVAFFDDDERIVPGWLQAIIREFADPATDYMAGPVLPLTDSALPDWLPSGFGGVLGIIDNGAERQRYAPGFGGMLTQGNCALRRSVFAAIGAYPAELATSEDRWLNQWLTGQGKQGFYCPDFAVHHVMQPERITRSYFRSWAAREGRDRAVCDRLATARALITQPWYWKEIAGCAARWILQRGTAADRFHDELMLRIAAAYARQWAGAGPISDGKS